MTIGRSLVRALVVTHTFLPLGQAVQGKLTVELSPRRLGGREVHSLTIVGMIDRELPRVKTHRFRIKRLGLRLLLTFRRAVDRIADDW